ncbi:hypothetical protein AGLY_015885 [Aphis glycines]|uniref:Uncharacterized protein n=1 Tax=Aphis glycines TaxID=307491 RepID=A0A6G0T186_APHGL|nr:hypothetical protein AGLY_015885 [Aphis glycines]
MNWKMRIFDLPVTLASNIEYFSGLFFILKKYQNFMQSENNQYKGAERINVFWKVKTEYNLVNIENYEIPKPSHCLFMKDPKYSDETAATFKNSKETEYNEDKVVSKYIKLLCEDELKNFIKCAKANSKDLNKCKYALKQLTDCYNQKGPGSSCICICIGGGGPITEKFDIFYYWDYYNNTIIECSQFVISR